ncbi:hypothetical protein ABIB54_002262 [Frigoribacterium sp. UYMn621]
MPVGEIVPRALAATERGWTVVIAGIHRADIPAMNNERDLFYERDLRTVTAKTRTEGMPFCGPPPTSRLRQRSPSTPSLQSMSPWMTSAPAGRRARSRSR